MSTNQEGTPKFRHATLHKLWFSPLQMRMSEMISEVVPVWGWKKSSKHIFFLNHRYRGFSELSEIKRGSPYTQSGELLDSPSEILNGFTLRVGHTQSSDKSQPYTLPSFFNEYHKKLGPCSRSPRSPTDLRFCDSIDADLYTLVVCLQGHALGVIFYKEDRFKLLHVLWRVFKVAACISKT